MGGPLPVGMPWWAWTLVAIAVATAVPLGGVLQALINRGLKRNVAKVVEQTENEHGNSEYPNLRDELTVVRKMAETILEGQKRHDSEIGNIRREQGLTREDVGQLRKEHHETRAWVQAEASERRAITNSVGELTGALKTHISSAETRDRQIAELQQVVIHRKGPERG